MKKLPSYMNYTDDKELDLIVTEVLKLKDEKPKDYDKPFGYCIHVYEDFLTLLDSKIIKMRTVTEAKRFADLMDIVNYIRLALRDDVLEKP